MLTRILLLCSLSWIMRLTAPLVTVFGNAISGRDLILLVGGLFLLAKSTHEIHQKLEGDSGHAAARVPASFLSVLVQIMVLDMVFSLDSVITAVGMANQLGVMITAVMIAVLLMMAASGVISAFVERRPTVKMLALSFLLLIGVTLIAEGLDQHIPKGYVYFAMAFSVFVEMLNLRLRPSQRDSVHCAMARCADTPGGWRFSCRRAKVANPSRRRGRLWQRACGSYALLGYRCEYASSYAWSVRVSTLFAPL